MDHARLLVKKYGNCNQRLLKEIVTGDETFVYYFQPDRKQKNMAWVSKDSTRPQIAKKSKDNEKGSLHYFLWC